METLPALLIAALALMASGPVTLASAAAGAAWPGRATAYVLAMSTGTITVILLVAVGVTGLVASIPGARPVIAAAGMGYILYLAWRIASAPPIGALSADRRPPPLLGGYAMAIANPKAWAAFAALFSGYPLIPDDPVAGGAAKAVILCMPAASRSTSSGCPCRSCASRHNAGTAPRHGSSISALPRCWSFRCSRHSLSKASPALTNMAAENDYQRDPNPVILRTGSATGA